MRKECARKTIKILVILIKKVESDICKRMKIVGDTWCFDGRPDLFTELNVLESLGQELSLKAQQILYTAPSAG